MSSAAEFGERLASLLASSSVSPEEFADRLELTPDDLRRILDGAAGLEPSDVVAAADILDVPIPVLTGDLPVGRHLGVSLRLGLLADRNEAPIEALAYADRMLSHQAVLDDLLGPVDGPQVPVSTDRYGIAAGRSTADRVRRLCDLGREPLTDLVGLVESFGFPVVFRALPENLHGVNVRDGRGGRTSRVIVISTRGGWPMQRYTLAHELCHALYDDAGQLILDRLEDTDVVEEVRAEVFARNLLLPSSALTAELAQRRIGRDPSVWLTAVPELMLRWGVSRVALLRSLVSDGHATEAALSEVRELPVYEMFRTAGLAERWTQLCVGEHEESGSPLLVRRAVEAFGRGLVSVRFVADVLDEDLDATRNLLASAGWLDTATG